LANRSRRAARNHAASARRFEGQHKVVIVIDDFGLTPLADETVRDLLDILDDRYDRKSTLITSQLPVDQLHAYLGDRTVADAIRVALVGFRRSTRGIVGFTIGTGQHDLGATRQPVRNARDFARLELLSNS
jgi:hypothetical protein